MNKRSVYTAQYELTLLAAEEARLNSMAAQKKKEAALAKYDAVSKAQNNNSSGSSHLANAFNRATQPGRAETDNNIKAQPSGAPSDQNQQEEAPEVLKTLDSQIRVNTKCHKPGALATRRRIK
ncbi:MAG: hypothetical protein ACQEQL_07480 [Pseudomonadota bacterium]